MKKIFAFLCLVFVISSCGNNQEVDTENQSGSLDNEPINSQTPVNSDSQDDFISDNPIVEIDSFEESENSETNRFQVKNNLVVNKEILDSIVTKCQFFEGEIDYVEEEGERVVPDEPFTIKSHLYDAVENGYCPGNESKEKKYEMVNTLLDKQLPEKFKQFEGIDSMDDIDVTTLNIDLNQPNYKQELLLFTAMYMYTLDESENDEFEKYIGIYNSHITDISQEYGRVSEEYYFPILITLAARNNDCQSYINDYLIEY